MSSTTKRKVVTIHTTCLNIKELCIFTADARVRTQASTWGFVLGNGTGFLTSISVFICHIIPPMLHTHFLFAYRRGNISIKTTGPSLNGTQLRIIT